MTQKQNRKIIVTGGAGFIGSHLVDLLIEKGCHVLVLDKLTYAGNRNNLLGAEATGPVQFVEGDICDKTLLEAIFRDFQPQGLYHLAAESHVDNSINDASIFLETNIMGTAALLQAALDFWKDRPDRFFRFLHVSTDEVFGHLGNEDPAFCETTAYAPNSPYSASKAASDHLARAWQRTYKLPVITTNCSNNFGPRQHNEKLIPTIIRRAVAGQAIPIYGTGENIRDWLYVKDHCQGLYKAMERGVIGESYCFGGRQEWRNIDLAKAICLELDSLRPLENDRSYSQQITFVTDRKGHDWRYAINSARAEQKLGFQINLNFRALLRETIRSYLD